ncbi:hypothetical protein Nos7524_3934 [Nostoc sp. PCC 7524]|uniref:hypothetical protein n=1 Tax=Nostoc sp. (strain ATCC 29411 / PCC 7524) TaxID=28072 RepID=UPI00029F0C78|nr:hypothetical protein [Nostoc sp. PCC 7524]AFY49707.1 hypothetical protein Nos7524_3934 [Nostoc sp. PCC 7524]
MQTNSNNSSSFASANSNFHLGKLLIPRSQRRMFFFQLTLMTVIGWVVGGIASIAIERIIWQSLPPNVAAQPQIWSFWIRLVGNMVFAVIFAADQALVLRRYISFWLWLLATSIGWLLAYSVSTAWIHYISTIANSFNDTLTSEVALTLGFLSTLLYILSGIWLGLCQWLVLRRYTSKVWWWNFLPSLAFLCISVLVWLLSLVQNLIPEVHRTPLVYWSEQGFTAMILGVVPAIGLCTLKKHLHRKTGIARPS